MKNNRLRLDLKLKKDGELILSTKKYIKQRIVALVQGRKNSEWTLGTLRVWYSITNDYYNQFNFTSLAELEQQLSICTEPRLIKEFMEGL